MGSLRRTGARPGGGGLTKAPGACFVVLERAGSPEALLAEAEQTCAARTAVLRWATSPALVLGSAQRTSAFDLDRCAAAGLEVLRRRSGGGAVVVRPGAQVWVDFFVPRDDPLFDDDVLASFGFVGQIWLAAICDVLPSAADSVVVSSGPLAATPWSTTLCFGGLGAGEVSIDGRKVVGVSQRRDRRGARFHSMALLEFDPDEMAFLLDGPESLRREAAAFLAGSATAIPGGRDSAPLLAEAIVNRLV
jgi:lipoate-protein ligase A